MIGCCFRILVVTMMLLQPLMAFPRSNSLSIPQRVHPKTYSYHDCFFLPLNAAGKKNEEEKTQRTTATTYEESDATSKGIVSSLTNIVNLLSPSFLVKEETQEELVEEGEISSSSLKDCVRPPLPRLSPPSSPNELLRRIRNDYEKKNYLWTGDIDVPCFEEETRFTDPTLSFVGTDQFVNNIRNLRPIVDAIAEPNTCQSKLLRIDLNAEEAYVQTRWNMVGVLSGLPWKPKIDVIGRTKFWYRSSLAASTTTAITTTGTAFTTATPTTTEAAAAVAKNENTSTSAYTTTSTTNDNNVFRVYFYDEEWEIPAWLALLQIITPAGMIPSSSEK